jgi:hypothetical protein
MGHIGPEIELTAVVVCRAAGEGSVAGCAAVQ